MLSEANRCQRLLRARPEEYFSLTFDRHEDGLAELLEKGSDTDLLREMRGFVTQRLMDLDVDGRCGAGHLQPDS